MSDRRGVSIVTLNTWKAEGDYPRRVAAPDILLLQEVFIARSLGENTAESLARLLGMDAHVLPLRRKARLFGGRPVDSHSGLAILSRLRVARLEADPAADRDTLSSGP